MDSIFYEIEGNTYWIEGKPQSLPSSLHLRGPFRLSQNKEKLSEAQSFLLAQGNLIEVDADLNPLRFTPVTFKLFQAFVEEIGLSQLFGFKLGSNEFFVDSGTKFDSIVSEFRRVCVFDSFENDFVVIKELGKGSSSTVYLVQNLQTRKQFAAKFFDKDILTIKKNWVKNLVQEIEILSQLDHPSIAQLYSVYESSTHVILILEYLPYGDLFKRVIKQKKFSEEDVSRFTKSLLEVLDYIHSKNIVHRDLKLENIMMTSENNFSFKLIDFGLAYLSPHPQSQRCGSPGYIAPEVLSREEYDSKVDIFSAGVVLFIISSGAHPFSASTPAKVLNVNIKCQVNTWHGLRGMMRDIVMSMMSKEPESRPTAADLLTHPFVYRSKRGSFSVNLVSTLTGSIRLDS